MKFKRVIALLLALIMVLCVAFTACDSKNDSDDGGKGKVTTEKKTTAKKTTAASDEEEDDRITLDNIPEYSGNPYVPINNNQPEFSEEDMAIEEDEVYGALDNLKRCTYALARLSKSTMPADGEKRGSISHVYPTGWKTGENNNNNQYDAKVVPGGYIYNRCHLIGWQLSAENANKSNLITGTQYMNIQGMVPFENMIADYIKETGNHVMYRVTPIFEGDNLLASGVHLEAYSVEDDGEGICFSVYVYNVQPGIKINYATGENRLDDSSDSAQTTETTQKTETTGSTSSGDYKYVLNTNSKKIHTPTCRYAENKYRENTNKTLDELKGEGYTACGTCKPS